jgi:hypothetical protein
MRNFQPQLEVFTERGKHTQLEDLDGLRSVPRLHGGWLFRNLHQICTVPRVPPFVHFFRPIESSSDFLQLLEVSNATVTCITLVLVKPRFWMGVEPTTFSVLKECAASQTCGYNVGLLHVGCDLVGQSTKQDDVGSDENILTLVLGAIAVDVLVIYVIQSINPPLVVHANEVNELVRNYGHRVTLPHHAVRPARNERNGRFDWWIRPRVTVHEPPQSRRGFDGATDWYVTQLRKNPFGFSYCPSLTVTCRSYVHNVDVWIDCGVLEWQPDTATDRSGQ